MLAHVVVCSALWTASPLPAGYLIAGPSSPHLKTASVARLHLHALARYMEGRQLPEHTVAAFKTTRAWLRAADGPAGLVVDAGCGTGRSSVRLGETNPGKLVLGIDRSLVRLTRGAPGPAPATGTLDEPLAQLVAPNVLVVRADLPTFWRLAAEEGLQCEQQCLFFPNPYPKPSHLKRRWHAHPAFPLLLALGGDIDLRSNWRVYVEEFAVAVRALAELDPAQLSRYEADPAVAAIQARAVEAARRMADRGVRARQYEVMDGDHCSEFELKYARAGLPLYRLQY